MNRMGWGTVKKGMAGCKSVEREVGKCRGFSFKWGEINPGNGEKERKITVRMP